MKYLFGPVNSRRLGKSLGIDLMPYKTCSLNCVYCECGKTTNLTCEIAEYVPTDEVLREIDSVLSAEPKLDVVTFSGSGEPTLHSRIGKIIDYIKDKYPHYKIAVLTNGTLLNNENVRRSLSRADIIVTSLDAVSPSVFTSILHPAAGLSEEHVVKGLRAFAKEYQGMLCVEVFIVPDYNDSLDELQKIKDICLEVKPSCLQLNTLDRPGTENWVKTVSEEKLIAIKNFFHPLNALISLRPQFPVSSVSFSSDVIEGITSTLLRRPSTAQDLAEQTGFRLNEIKKVLARMINAGLVRAEKMERGEFFSLYQQKGD